MSCRVGAHLGLPSQAEPSPHQALLGLVPLTHQRVREASARFLSVLGDRAQGLSNVEGRRDSQAVTPRSPGKGLLASSQHQFHS